MPTRPGKATLSARNSTNCQTWVHHKGISDDVAENRRRRIDRRMWYPLAAEVRCKHWPLFRCRGPVSVARWRRHTNVRRHHRHSTGRGGSSCDPPADRHPDRIRLAGVPGEERWVVAGNAAALVGVMCCHPDHGGRGRRSGDEMARVMLGVGLAAVALTAACSSGGAGTASPTPSGLRRPHHPHPRVGRPASHRGARRGPEWAVDASLVDGHTGLVVPGRPRTATP